MVLLSTNLGQFIFKVFKKAKHVFSSIWNGNYEILETSFFGISILEILGVIIGISMILNFLKFIFSIGAEILKESTKDIFKKLLGFAGVILRKILIRVKYVLLYFWNLERTQYYRHRLGLFFEDFTSNIQSPNKNK